MKKSILFLILAILACTDCFAAMIYYRVGKSSVTLTKVEGYTGSFVVPSTYTYNGKEYPVTSLGDGCFSGCTDLTSITIPSSVTSLGDSCFFGCTSLTSINVDDANTSYASVDGVLFNKSLTKLIAYPGGKTGEFTIPSYMTLETYCFSGCTGLTSINVDDANTSYASVDGVLFNKSLTKLIAYPGGKTGEYTIPSYMTLETYCFFGCAGLTSINVDDANTSYASVDGVLYNKSLTKLIAYPGGKAGEYTIPSSVTSLEVGCFSGCTSLTNIQSSSVTSLPAYCFLGCTGLTSISLPSSVTSLEDNCFYGSRITSIDLQSTSITTLGANTFYGCTGLTSVDLPSSLTSLEEYCFDGISSLTTLTIPSSVTRIGNYAFNGCTNLSSVRFEDGSETISLGVNKYGTTGYGLFYDCPLTSLYLGRNILYKYNDTDDGYYTAFLSTPSKFGYSAFYGARSKLTSVTIGDSVTFITPYLFYGNTAFTIIRMSNVQTIGKFAFNGCNKLATLNLGTNLATVGNYAFGHCTNLTNLSFPDSLKSVGDLAFYYCSSVTTTTFGENCGLKTIGKSAFENCAALTAVKLPAGVTNIGKSAFKGNTKLTYIDLGQSLKAISDSTFSGCVALSEMTVPDGVVSIGSCAFYNCTGMATYSFPETLDSIASEVFYNNSGITQMRLPGSLTRLGRNCFYGCTRLATLRFKDGEGTLKIDNALTYSSVLKEAKASISEVSAAFNYFIDCPLRTVYFGKNLSYTYSGSQSIYDVDQKTNVEQESSPFANKKTIRAVTFGPNVSVIYDYLLVGCSTIEKLTISAGVRTIKSYAFSKCTGVTSLQFKEGVQTIGNYAFNQCTGLPSLQFVGSLQTIGSYSFNECTGLTAINFVSGLQTIGTYAFRKCNHYAVLDLPETLKSIPEGVFCYNDSLKTAYFPGSLTSIGNDVFRGDSILANVTFRDGAETLTLGYQEKTSGNHSPLFVDCPLVSLYIGRNIIYNNDITLSNGSTNSASQTYGYSPFYNQKGLSDISFSQNGTVTYLYHNLLYGAASAESLVLPNSLVTIYSSALRSMYHLNSAALQFNNLYKFLSNKKLLRVLPCQIFHLP